ncbi:MAG: hypothetical protein LBH14_08540 [Desulfobulbaceae bacterium]|jgi:hypothetical protein|nr:hypothetical protein [Desulfobulbaceae bacterium]
MAFSLWLHSLDLAKRPAAFGQGNTKNCTIPMRLDKKSRDFGNFGKTVQKMLLTAICKLLIKISFFDKKML